MSSTNEINEINHIKTDNQIIESTQISFGNISFEEKPEEIPSASNKLLLTGPLFFNKDLIIDQQGLKNGLRNKNDSKVFFGFMDVKDYTGTYYNDFIVNTYPRGGKSNLANFSGRIFEVSYSKKDHSFQIFMINSSMCLYYHIEHLFYFETSKNFLFLLGRIFLEITQKEINKKMYIDIRVEYGEDEEDFEEFSFSQEDAPITIGRVDCKITIQNSSISKRHAVIEFSDNLKQFFFRDDNSTNGSILILKEEDSLKIKGDMKFKLNDIMFHILELP